MSLSASRMAAQIRVIRVSAGKWVNAGKWVIEGKCPSDSETCSQATVLEEWI